jgi:hypothetical protein
MAFCADAENDHLDAFETTAHADFSVGRPI